MRQAGSLSSEADARRLADYLLTLGISTKIDPSGDAWLIWVRQEDQIEQARKELADFRFNPQAERYQLAAHNAEQLRREEKRRDAEAKRNVVDLRGRWDATTARSTPVTWVLISASIWVALQSSFGGAPEQLELLWFAELHPLADGWVRYSLEETLTSGQWWRLLSPIFIHFGAMHLLFNMLWMYDLGRRVEALVGTWRYIAMVVLIGLGSNLAQFYFTGPHFGGMSGVVYGLIGFAWVQYRYASRAMMFLGQGAMFIAVAWLVLGFANMLGPMANWAHLVGLVIGMVLGGLPIAWSKLRRRR